jgi:hypothetical protein
VVKSHQNSTVSWVTFLACCCVLFGTLFFNIDRNSHDDDDERFMSCHDVVDEIIEGKFLRRILGVLLGCLAEFYEFFNFIF